jgi:rhamnose utilization protein RhaD (predicted bifunctional aldolase and dehydrogenase)/NAD(P)-dependent dehydrogenase (short-subunit alcohol dehydrogenase family)
MKSLWNDQEAARYSGDLGQRVYTSRLLGRNPDLVLHGGGNTSVKIVENNIFGEPEEILYVKGSGWDLATIEAAGFAPARLRYLQRLTGLKALSDVQMANELRSATITPNAPAPSVEAILHALLPFKFVDHTHADSIVALTNTPDGEEHIRQVYGDKVVVVPYVMAGFDLAKLCAELFPAKAGPQTVGMVLMNHGLFTFADDAKTSYERMIELVSLAEEYLASRGSWELVYPAVTPPERSLREELAGLRRDISKAAGTPMIMATHIDVQTLSFAQREDLTKLALQGPATPDHIIRTKQLPLIGRNVEAYVEAYKAYFDKYSPTARQPLTMLDPAPRVVLDPELGLLTVGRTVKDAAIAEDVYRHTIEVILRATALSEYRALPPDRLFEMEYWDLEQAKLKLGSKPAIFTGEVALVTGAASGIGKACVEALRARGAAVAALDLNPAISDLFKRPEVLGIPCDVTDEAALERALEATVRAFGGLDMLILNAGIFPANHRIESVNLAEWEKTMQVNLNANLSLMRQAYPLLKLSPKGGRVTIIGSKNVAAPGPGASAYSASKAALTQLARVAALEWGNDGIRVNLLHPDAVFDTGIWTDEVIQGRAKNYGMTVEQYKTKNVLHVEITSRDVGELAAEVCGPIFAKTTGAQIPIDGGNDRVI